MTTASPVAEPKPYHHGDLRRALVDAAVMIVERDGPTGLTLRAVAREAGVSPAAPYHHFKDKDELLYAVAKEGFRRQRHTMLAANDGGPAGPRAMGVAYVEFAHAHPSLYRVMYDSARKREIIPDSEEQNEGGLMLMRKALVEASGGKINELDLGLSAVAGWCVAHGLAEISTFPQFKQLKEALGGERAFLQAVFDHFGYLYRHNTGQSPEPPKEA